jgi:hypothetical protein
MQVDRSGVFRCKLLDHGIGKSSKKGYPQLIIKVKLTELFDRDVIGDDCPDGFQDIAEWDMETQGYISLYGIKKGESNPSRLLSYEQVMKVFGWDGESLAELAAGTYDDLEFQVRITENDYEDTKYPFQVSWIDTYDADPDPGIKKLDADEIKSLDAQFSNITASAKKAASAKPKPRAAKAKKSKAKEDKPLTDAERKAKLKEKSAKIKEAAKAQAKKSSPPPPEDDSDKLPLPEPKEELTKAEAWERIYEMRDPGIDDSTVMELWKAAIEEVGGEGATSKDLNGKQWYQVKEIVLADCGKF